MSRARFAAALVALALGASTLGACSLLLETDTKKLGGANLGPRADGGTGDGTDAGADGQGQDGNGCASCDDGISCTADQCIDGACQHVANDGVCKRNERCNLVKGCVPQRCRDDSDCSDGNACNGEEHCGGAGGDAVTGCSAGQALSCDDGVDCTSDSCDPQQGCVYPPDASRCNDNIDCTVDACDPSAGCTNTPDDSGCDFCDKGATCSPLSGCVDGFLPRSCNDLDPCTVDRCDPVAKQCVNEGSCNSDAPDDCSQPQTIELNFDGTAQVKGSFADVTSTFNTSCGQGGGRDAVYRIQIDQPSDIVLDTTASSARTVLAVARQCSSQQDFALACAGAVSNAEGGSRLIIHGYDPDAQGSDLFVLVDGATASEKGTYTLDVTVQDVGDDACGGSVLTLDGCGTVLGFMADNQPADVWGTERGTCQPGNGKESPEAILRIPGASDGNVSLSVVSDAFSPALYVRKDCGSSDGKNELGCENAASAKNQPNRADFTVQLGSKEEAFVIVDGATHNGDRYVFSCTP